MNANELRRWLRKRGCTFHTHKGGSGHLTVRRGDRAVPAEELGRGAASAATRGVGDG